MGHAGATEPCPQCGNDAVRVFSVVALRQSPRSLRTVAERAEQSRDAPAVARRDSESGTSAFPPSDPAPFNPALRRLVGGRAAPQLRTVPHPAQPPSGNGARPARDL